MGKFKVLKSIYGQGKPRELLNRAVRAEVVGGEECLTAIAAADQMHAKLKAFNAPDQEEGQIAVDALRRIADRMRSDIAETYESHIVTVIAHAARDQGWTLADLQESDTVKGLWYCNFERDGKSATLRAMSGMDHTGELKKLD